MKWHMVVDGLRTVVLGRPPLLVVVAVAIGLDSLGLGAECRDVGLRLLAVLRPFAS